MSPVRRLLIWILLGLGAPTTVGAQQVKVLTIGGSLSEEYAFQTAFSAPDSAPSVANLPNWIEFLAANRSADFDFGTYTPATGGAPAPLATGHAYNWSIPSFTCWDWVVTLGSASGPYGTRVANGINAQLPDISAVVIMIGMRDLLDDYPMIYAGTEPANWFDVRLARIRAIQTHFENLENAPPVVICTVPDPGVTPALAALYPDAGKRAVASAKIALANLTLKTLASQAGKPIADIHAVLLSIAPPGPFTLNRIPFVNAGAPENPSDHLYCKDALHPAMVASGLIAGEVIEALNQIAGISIPPLTNREILEAAPGIDPDQPFLDWIATQGVGAEDGLHDNPDGDVFDNLAEFAFDLNAGTWNQGLAHDWSGPSGDLFSILWQLNPAAEGFVEIGAERSANLTNWTPLDTANITYLGAGYWRAAVNSSSPTTFLRAVVNLAP